MTVGEDAAVYGGTALNAVVAAASSKNVWGTAAVGAAACEMSAAEGEGSEHQNSRPALWAMVNRRAPAALILLYA